ncbi:MAG: alpha-ribazole phosphatase [Pseudomonadota bacterium]
MSVVTTVDLLRHGACTGGDIFRGRTDVPLTEEGWSQMHEALACVAGWTKVISSPLGRCEQFAAALGVAQSVPVQVDQGLREMDFGIWDGRPVEEVARRYPDMLTRFYSSPEHVRLPEGESFQEFSERVLTSWGQVLMHHEGSHLLLVTHGGVIRLLLAHLLQMPMSSMSRLHVPYACRARLKIYGRGEDAVPTLSTFNAREEWA